MTAKTEPALRPNCAADINQKEPDVPGFPSLSRSPSHRYTTESIKAIIGDGMSEQAVRNWLTGAHAKGEIDDEQVRLFWPGDR